MTWTKEDLGKYSFFIYLIVIIYLTTMVDLVNNVVAIRINSRDRVNISDSTTNFTIALRKSLRNIAAVNVSGVVIPRTDTLIGPNNDTLTGEIRIDNVINPFEVTITRTNYTETTLAAELATQLNGNTDMLSYGITFVVSWDPITKRMSIVATYPFGASHTWSISIDYTALRDIIGIGVAGTTTQVFAADAGSSTLNIACGRTASIVRALTYNITSDALTSSTNTSYISSLGKLFQVAAGRDTLNFESLLTVNNNIIDLPIPTATVGNQMKIGISLALSTTGTTMVVGSRRYGAYVFTRVNTLSPWVLLGSGPVIDTDKIYNDQGLVVSISGDGATIAFSSFDGNYLYDRTGNSWVRSSGVFLMPVGGGTYWSALNIDGSVFASGGGAAPGFVLLNTKTNGSWDVGQLLTNPVGSVKFGSGLSLSNTGDNFLTCDKSFGSPVAYVYFRTAGVWNLQQTLVPATAVGGFIDGVSMAGNGQYLAISSSTDNAGVGATWIYNWTGVTWNEQQKIAIASTSIAINSAGDTIVIGASAGNGKVSVYKRSGILWTAQLSNYVGSSGSGSSQGAAVAITASGDDIIWGGPTDPATVSNQGAVWSAHRSGATWSQTLGKITSTLGVYDLTFGKVLVMSDDGHTIAVGMPDINSGDGVVYVYVNNGFSWEIQEVFNLAPGIGAGVGISVALSNDGNTLAFGGSGDFDPGSTWVYTRTGTTWVMQAHISVHDSPILGQGFRIALSGSGNTLAIVGLNMFGIIVMSRSSGVWTVDELSLGAGSLSGIAPSIIDMSDNGDTIVASYPGQGAVVFNRSGGIWSQMGSNFLSFHTPVVATVSFGDYSCISADGNTIAVSDIGDNAGRGQVFIYRLISGAWTQTASLHGTDLTATDHQGFSIKFINGGNTCLFSAPYAVSIGLFTITGIVSIFSYDGVSWSQTGSQATGPYDFGYVISGQKTGSTYVIGAPSILSPGGRLIGKVHVYTAPGVISYINQVTVPAGFYSIFDLVNLLNDILANVVPVQAGTTSGYSASFDGSRLTITAAPGGGPIVQNNFRITQASTFDIARFPNQNFKTSQVSNLPDFSINNNMIKSVISHSDNSDNVLVDNTPDTPYRKYPAGYTVDAGTAIDIQLRDDRDRIVDLNGSDWIMTIYATVRS